MEDNIWALLNNAIAISRHGSGHRFEWNESSGWTVTAVERLLTRYGIGVYARQYKDRNGERALRVNSRQAKWAESILLTAGVPLEGAPAGGRALARLPEEWGVPAKPKDPVAYLVRGMATILGTPIAKRKPKARRRRAMRGWW